MADEFEAAGLNIKILGINQDIGASGIVSLTDSMDLPVVQDTAELGVWSDWGAAWRDVFLVNEDNVHVGTYNLVTHDLRTDDDYNELQIPPHLPALSVQPQWTNEDHQETLCRITIC